MAQILSRQLNVEPVVRPMEQQDEYAMNEQHILEEVRRLLQTVYQNNIQQAQENTSEHNQDSIAGKKQRQNFSKAQKRVLTSQFLKHNGVFTQEIVARLKMNPEFGAFSEKQLRWWAYNKRSDVQKEAQSRGISFNEMIGELQQLYQYE